MLKLSKELFSKKINISGITQEWIKIFQKFQQIRVQQDNSKTKVKKYENPLKNKKVVFILQKP